MAIDIFPKKCDDLLCPDNLLCPIQRLALKAQLERKGIWPVETPENLSEVPQFLMDKGITNPNQNYEILPGRILVTDADCSFNNPNNNAEIIVVDATFAPEQ